MLRRLVPVLGSVLLLAGCGGGTTVSPTAERVEGKLQTATVAKGDVAAGKSVFTAQGCGSCHTLEEANAKGNVGPNLDETLQDKDADYVRESIINPNAEIAKGFQPGVMPQTYGEQLSNKQIADLVALLTKQS